MFYDAIKAKYPQITTIASTNVTSRPMEVIDEHIYSSPTSLAAQAGRYDTYDRGGPKVFVGEYAARRGNSQDISTGPLGYSLGDQVLSDPDPEASNTLADPARVTPRDLDLRGSGGQFSYEAPANSLSVVTIQR